MAVLKSVNLTSSRKYGTSFANQSIAPPPENSIPISVPFGTCLLPFYYGHPFFKNLNIEDRIIRLRLGCLIP